MEPFIKMSRSQEVEDLLRNPNCFVVLAQIAYRAKRTDAITFNDLTIGEALVGDYGNIGLSQQEYRTAKNKLTKWNLASFRSTNKGTIAKLLDTRIFDINAEKINTQTTTEQQASNNPTTTNKNDKNERSVCKKTSFFKKPTLEEIQKYCLERGNNVNASRFYDFYESKDWRVGKNKMKNWQAAIRTWEADRANKDSSQESDYCLPG